MKVLFVVQGEGRGHLTQALTLEKMLLAHGHEVVGMLVGKSKSRKIPDFFYEKAQAPIMTFDSPNFLPSKNNCHIGHIRSTIYNILKTPQYVTSIHEIWHCIRDSHADLVINFYEVLCGLTYFLLRLMVPAHIEQECNAYDAEREGVGVSADRFDLSRLLDFAHNYEEDVDFRFWENNAATRILAALEDVAENHEQLPATAMAY